MNTALRVSLAVNLALIGVVGALLWHASRPLLRSNPEPSQTGGQHSTAPAAAEGAIRRVDASTGSATPLDYLQRMGVSRQVAIDAVLADFHRRWDERFADLEDRYAPRSVPEREYIELGRLRDAAQARALLAMMGEDGYRGWEKEQALRAVNPGNVPLTAAESEAVSRFQKDFEEQHRELQMAMEDGVADMADAAAMQREAQEARDRAIAELVGPERLAAMRGVSDPVADVYRRFGDLSPTPTQARAVLEVDADQRARAAALEARVKAASELENGSVLAELKSLHEAREDALRRIFGAQAYEATRRESDPTYRTLRQYATAWELQDAEVDQVYLTLRPFLTQAEQTRTAAGWSEAAGRSVNWREVNAAIDEARQATELALQHVIGAKRLARLRDNGVLGGR